MLPWQPSRDARELRARSRALWGAGIGYVLVLLFLTFAFRSQKPLLSVKFRVGGPACVRFHHGAKGGARKQGNGFSQRALYAAALLRKKTALLQARKLRMLEQKKAAAAKRAAVRKKKRDEIARQKAEAAKEAQEAARKAETKERERMKALALKKQAEEALKKQPNEKVPQQKVEPRHEEPVLEKVEKAPPPPEPTPEPEMISEQELAAEGGEDELEEIVLDDEVVSEDVELSRDVIALMAAISRVWKPPRGLNKVPQARLIVSVAKDGAVENVEIDVKSGVVAYDMAARAALWRTSYPSAFWGKRIAVLFGQQ